MSTETTEELRERIATLEATVAELQAAVEARAVARAALLLQAVSVAPGGHYGGPSDAEVRARAVSLAKGQAAIEGRGDAYIEGAFDSLVAATHVDFVRLSLSHIERIGSGMH